MIMGVSFAYLPSMQAIVGNFDIATILGAQLIGGVVAIFVGIFVTKLRKLVPAFDHRNGCLYNRSVALSDCSEIHGGRTVFPKLWGMAELACGISYTGCGCST